MLCGVHYEVLVVIIIIKTIYLENVKYNVLQLLLRYFLFEKLCTFLSFISKIKNIIKESGIFYWYFLNNCTLC